MSEQPIITPLELRRQEVAQYQANIAMYQAIADSLPADWPEHLMHLKNRKDTHDAAAEVDNIDDVILLGQLYAFQQAQAALRAETIELQKSLAILNFLESQEQE